MSQSNQIKSMIDIYIQIAEVFIIIHITANDKFVGYAKSCICVWKERMVMMIINLDSCSYIWAYIRC